jgi:hypothetical protein
MTVIKSKLEHEELESKLLVDSGNNRKFWEELISCFPLIRHGRHRKRKIGGGRYIDTAIKVIS